MFRFGNSRLNFILTVQTIERSGVESSSKYFIVMCWSFFSVWAYYYNRNTNFTLITDLLG